MISVQEGDGDYFEFDLMMTTTRHDAEESGINNTEVLATFKDFPPQGELRKGQLTVLSRRAEEEQKMGAVRPPQGGAWREPVNQRDGID
jgi:hypothetical protein